MSTRLIHKGQRGFTLIELLLVIAITGLITAGLTTTIMQVLTMSHGTANRMTAVRQVQQAGFWVSPDVQMAQSVNASGGPDVLLTLTWTEWATNVSHNVTYTLEDMSGGLKKLQRSHSVDGGAPTVTPIAEYIDDTIDPVTTEPKTNCVWAGGALNFTVTATVGGQSETRVYEVKPRPE